MENLNYFRYDKNIPVHASFCRVPTANTQARTVGTHILGGSPKACGSWASSPDDQLSPKRAILHVRTATIACNNTPHHQHCARESVFFFNLIDVFLERERNIFYPHLSLMYAFRGCFLYVPCPGIKPTTLMCQDDAPTNHAAWPGLKRIHNIWGPG